MTIKPWLLALHHGLSLQEALHSASLWSSTQSIETPAERKLHVRSGCMECFFFFPLTDPWGLCHALTATYA